MIGGALIDALEQMKAAMKETGAQTSPSLRPPASPIRYLGTQKEWTPAPWTPRRARVLRSNPRCTPCRWLSWRSILKAARSRSCKMTTAVDAGTVIHPQNLTGQIEGGMDMGVGFALRERYIAGQTKDWITFKFPTIGHSFDMETIILETPRPRDAWAPREWARCPWCPRRRR